MHTTPSVLRLINWWETNFLEENLCRSVKPLYMLTQQFNIGNFS